MDTKVTKELQDLTYLSWTKIRNSSGTAGSFLKAYDDLGEKKKYYKLSNYNAAEGITGHESVNEIIADRLLNLLGIPHLEYELINGKILIDDAIYHTYLCMSEDFKKSGERKIALDVYYQAERLPGENLLGFCIRKGWEEYICQMLLVDYLLLNRDRHGANIEVLQNRKEKTLRLAPLFDHGLSLVFSCTTEAALSKFDVLADIPVQCCMGGSSAFENLKLIPKDRQPKINSLKETDKEILMYDLEDALPGAWREKIWEMIWKRWKSYESFCNQR